MTAHSNSPELARIPLPAEPAVSFSQAEPIWPEGREQVLNDFVGFRAIIRTAHLADGGTAILRIAAATFYRAFVNGRFVASGPARGPHGHFRVDQLDLTKFLSRQPAGDVVAIEVAGYNVNAYGSLDQPSFLQAEVIVDGKVLAATGKSRGGGGFKALNLPERIRKVPRFSFQRAFSEAYKLKSDSHRWREDPAARIRALSCANFPPVKLLPRRVAYPSYELCQPVAIVARGTLTQGVTPAELWKDRSLTRISPQLKGFPESELEAAPVLDYQYFKFDLQPTREIYHPQAPLDIAANSAILVDFGTNKTGFLGLSISILEPTRIYVSFDEILTDHAGVRDVSIRRVDCAYVIAYDLAPGIYQLEAFEPYTLRFLKISVVSGAAQVSNLYLREYASPMLMRAQFSCSDAGLGGIFRAAIETSAHNTVDLFMDCPSRERAGWLGDSFFHARAFHDAAGTNVLERAFLENYLLAPEPFPHLPEGVLPMCYPADHYDHVFIPQWTLWYILQLAEYLQRSGDRTMVDASRGKVQRQLTWFEQYRNRDGLLEKLPGWNFIEWSSANQFTADVNYPTNMLYAVALEAAGRMYSVTAWLQQAAAIKDTVRQQSWDGEFFVDNALRQPAESGEGGVLTRTRNRTEVCQYYAFYFDIATPESHPVLWQKLLQSFGPQRSTTKAYPEIHPANAFVGNYLRFELLARAGLVSQLIPEMHTLFDPMVQRTGTLWEHNGLQASANHGFASHALVWLVRTIAGLARIDHVTQQIHLHLGVVPLAWLDVALPLGSGMLHLKWQKQDGALVYKIIAPAGYTVQVSAAPGVQTQPTS